MNGTLQPTLDKLRTLTGQTPVRGKTPQPTLYKIHNIAARLGKQKVDDAIKRYGTGESAAALAKEYEVAASALVRLLRENNVVVRRKVISPEIKALLVKEYEAGATVADLEARHHISHGSVLRALHHAGRPIRVVLRRTFTVCFP